MGDIRPVPANLNSSDHGTGCGQSRLSRGRPDSRACQNLAFCLLGPQLLATSIGAALAPPDSEAQLGLTYAFRCAPPKPQQPLGGSGCTAGRGLGADVESAVSAATAATLAKVLRHPPCMWPVVCRRGRSRRPRRGAGERAGTRAPVLRRTTNWSPQGGVGGRRRNLQGRARRRGGTVMWSESFK